MSARSSTPRRLLRAAALLLVLFAVGHTIGFLTLQAPTPEARAVFDGMNDVHFSARGQVYSYGGFYRGFGLAITAYLVFTALVAWRLGDFVEAQPRLVGSLALYLLGLQLVNAVLAFVYFSLPPQVTSVLMVLVVGAAVQRIARLGAAPD